MRKKATDFCRKHRIWVCVYIYIYIYMKFLLSLLPPSLLLASSGTSLVHGIARNTCEKPWKNVRGSGIAKSESGKVWKNWDGERFDLPILKALGFYSGSVVSKSCGSVSREMIRVSETRERERGVKETSFGFVQTLGTQNYYCALNMSILASGYNSQFRFCYFFYVINGWDWLDDRCLFRQMETLPFCLFCELLNNENTLDFASNSHCCPFSLCQHRS